QQVPRGQGGTIGRIEVAMEGAEEQPILPVRSHLRTAERLAPTTTALPIIVGVADGAITARKGDAAHGVADRRLDRQGGPGAPKAAGRHRSRADAQADIAAGVLVRPVGKVRDRPPIGDACLGTGGRSENGSYQQDSKTGQNEAHGRIPPGRRSDTLPPSPAAISLSPRAESEARIFWVGAAEQ